MMNDENNNLNSQDPNNQNTNSESDALQNNNIKAVENIVPETNQSSSPSINTQYSDIDKIKIRHVLWQRFKKCSPKFKKAIPFILVAVVFFAAGIGTDRLLVRNRFTRGMFGRPGFQRSLPNGQFNGQFNGNGRQGMRRSTPFNNNNGSNGNNNNNNNNSSNNNGSNFSY